MVFDDTGDRPYKIQPFNKMVHVAVFRRLTTMANMLKCVPAPKTLGEWRMIVECLSSGTSLAPVLPADSVSYTWLWCVRAYLFAEMRAHGIKMLEVSNADDAEGLSAAFPDAKGWIKKFASGGGSVKALLKNLHHSGGVETLTCNLCIFGDAAIIKIPLADLERAWKSGALKKARKELDRPKMPAHPVHVLDVALSVKATRG
jgi:hypothetical protein